MSNARSSSHQSSPSSHADGNPGTASHFFVVLKQWLIRHRLLTGVYPSKVIKIRLHDEIPWPVKSLQTNDRIYIPAGEVVPCDSILATDSAIIDYSIFNNGYQVKRKRGELIYAGGRIVGSRVIVKVHETMTPNRFIYLLSLRRRLHREVKPNRERSSMSFMLLTTLSGFFQRMWPAGKTTEQKNGYEQEKTIRYEGLPLSENDMQLILFATTGREENYARMIRQEISRHVLPGNFAGTISTATDEGIAIGHLLQLGSAAFVGTKPGSTGTEIWLRIDSMLMGKFVFPGTSDVKAE